ncbi:predicted protein [Nematostella vectensis]|uniref:Uncharacterized protein n=1 Tax=Nematostella vectensis TaxID=45351 RepID=A7SYJ3_NEMVE|nr:predicted protein [Nematostella vectensis]|eukprot:XP_001623328.1 predicted protein [Nematostella vectensis]
MVVNMSDKTWKVLKGIIVTTGIGQDVMVTKYSPDKCPHIESMRNNFEKVYKMTSNPKGLAIIISISRYDGLKGCRFKSEQDFNNLKNLFEGIGYTIAPLQEIQSKAELEKELKQCVQSIQESHESLILAVMSHGDERGLYLGNGETVKVEDIIRFIIVQSGHLEGKPKIVFMDAPVLQDVIFAYSTVEGYASFRNTQGSWFINAIVDVFSKHAWEEDIVSLLTYVSYEVSRKLSFQGYKQIPAPQSTLTKKLFLLPGYFEDEQ